VVLSALARGISEQMIRDAIFNLTGHVKIFAQQYVDDPVIEHTLAEPRPELLSALNDPLIRRWVMRVKVPGVVSSERESAGITMVGVDPESERGVSVAGKVVSEGRGLEGPDDKGVVVGRKLLEDLRTQAGKRVVFTTRDTPGEIADRGFRIVGVFDAELQSTETSYAFFGRQTLQKMLKAEGRLSEVSVVAKERDEVGSIEGRLREVEPDLDIRNWLELEPLIDAMTRMQDGFLYLWFGVVMVCVSFGLVNTLFMSVFERSREIGVMQALGMRQGFLITQIFVEAVVLILLGSGLGVLAGIAGSEVLSGGIDISAFARGMNQAGIGTMIYPSLHAGDMIMIVLLMVVIGGLGSLYPAWSTAKQRPMEAITRL
jgi:ABC-type lipoprotein release transport system permease subunit